MADTTKKQGSVTISLKLRALCYHLHSCTCSCVCVSCTSEHCFLIVEDRMQGIISFSMRIKTSVVIITLLVITVTVFLSTVDLINFDITGGQIRSHLSETNKRSVVANNSIAASLDPPGNMSVAPDPSTELELYLRMSTANPTLPKFYASVLVQSMKYFWPDNVSMVVALDSERGPDHVFGDGIQKTFPFPKTCYIDPIKIVHVSGVDRMQRDMFYPELCTKKKYVGFIDTDTMFISRVIPELLFSDGKPIIVAAYGNTFDNFYVLVSHSTANIFQTKEVMRCMSNFPVIIKVQHLIELRHYVEKLHNMSFEEVLITKKASYFSQFNLMCQYIWMFHRDEYKFHFSFQAKKLTHLKHAREDQEYYDKTLTEEEKRPVARVALHYKYIVYANWKLEKTWRYLLLASVCYMGGFDLCPDKCTHFNRSGIRPEMFIFDYLDWTWDTRCTATQQEHYQRLAAYSSPWYSDIILQACNEVNTIRWTL